jgi:hypothetical protein
VYTDRYSYIATYDIYISGGLDTIKEAQHEDSKDMPHPVSRGGRSVRFSQDVPEVPAPPSTMLSYLTF